MGIGKINDKKVGQWEQFNFSESFVGNVEYVDGIAQNDIIDHDEHVIVDGEPVIADGKYIADDEHIVTDNIISEYIEYWPDGTKKVTGQYLADGSNKKTGLWTKWFNNGQKEEEGVFKNNVEIGVWKYWNYNGDQFDDIDYGNGQVGGGKKKKNQSKKISFGLNLRKTY